jgi:glycosyltransferase involved in cell wall biosynthesis
MTLLTIAIPSFNRAARLDSQLSWLCQEVRGYESECEILISDNSSTDHTADIIKKWQKDCSDIVFKANRNPENIGVMRNIAYCLQNARSKHVWVIGDDDDIQPGTLDYVLKSLKKNPELTLLTLNYSMFDVPTNSLRKAARFTLHQDQIVQGGMMESDRASYPIVLGFGFMSAQIYCTKVVQAAINSWPSSFNNLDVQIYWGAFCAIAGSAKVTNNVYVNYNCGDNILSKPKNWFKGYYCDAPQVYLKMLNIGYSKKFMRDLLVKTFFKLNEFKAIVKGIIKWPILGIRVVKALGMVVIASNLPIGNNSTIHPVEKWL